MKRSNLNRRDFIKTTVAGTFLATTPVIDSWAQKKDPIASDSGNAKSKKFSSTETREGTLIRADMSQCSPAENLSRNFEKDRWALIDYETIGGVKG
ncbi:MAG: hypothetical protein GQ561_09625, partial [Calditrichae bacterium]|nr:hypothetical protein [Calditrichia bacterium]